MSLLDKPLLHDCGNVICGDCGERICLENNPKCPFCRSEININNTFKKAPIIIQNMVNEYKVECVYCNKISSKKDHDSHIETCKNEEIKCNILNLGCGCIYKRMYYKQHLKKCPIYINKDIFKKIIDEKEKLLKENKELKDKIDYLKKTDNNINCVCNKNSDIEQYLYKLKVIELKQILKSIHIKGYSKCKNKKEFINLIIENIKNENEIKNLIENIKN